MLKMRLRRDRKGLGFHAGCERLRLPGMGFPTEGRRFESGRPLCDKRHTLRDLPPWGVFYWPEVGVLTNLLARKATPFGAAFLSVTFHSHSFRGRTSGPSWLRMVGWTRNTHHGEDPVDEQKHPSRHDTTPLLELAEMGAVGLVGWRCSSGA